jgi:hypothetical protein
MFRGDKQQHSQRAALRLLALFINTTLFSAAAAAPEHDRFSLPLCIRTLIVRCRVARQRFNLVQLLIGKGSRYLI